VAIAVGWAEALSAVLILEPRICELRVNADHSSAELGVG
jgi:hypothetical protein